MSLRPSLEEVVTRLSSEIQKRNTECQNQESNKVMVRRQAKRKQHALFYLPEEGITGVHQTKSILEGTPREGESVRLLWDSNSHDIPAKVIKLSDDVTELLEFSRNELNSVPLVGSTKSNSNAMENTVNSVEENSNPVRNPVGGVEENSSSVGNTGGSVEENSNSVGNTVGSVEENSVGNPVDSANGASTDDVGNTENENSCLKGEGPSAPVCQDSVTRRQAEGNRQLLDDIITRLDVLENQVTAFTEGILKSVSNIRKLVKSISPNLEITTALNGEASSTSSITNPCEGGSIVRLKSEANDLLPNLNTSFNKLGGNNVTVPTMCTKSSSLLPSAQSSSFQNLRSSIVSTEESLPPTLSESKFSLESIQKIKEQARSAMDFCTKVMRLIFRKEELKGKIVGTKKENSVDEERMKLIRSLYSAFYKRGDPQWQEWTKCMTAMNAHIRKYINR